MCKLSEGFKLCTCGTIPLNETHWVLRQVNPSQPVVIGMIVQGFEVIKKYNWIQKELNQNPCFDFDYTPKDGDRLIFNIIEEEAKESVTLRYVNNRFEKGWQLMLIPDRSSGKVISSGLVC